MSLNTNQDMFSGSALSNNVKLVCQSKLNNPMSLTPDERDYCTLKHNIWQLVQMFHQINKADDLPLNFGRDSLKITKSLRQIQNIVLKRLLDHLGPKFQYLRFDDLQEYLQMESWESHHIITNHDQ
ncbi:hypothetical protein PPACK8108_LOCUS21110 [Phakopsora pachyrhizi]|uniref:Uncharacterized protein n=1 Tax=Phakopsora pachyrhizi TaxID=170000 RepID=A0AAV0BGY4_PHAPC|nr:hypothetical protein PPACK8108_LOCUS21110 [Phakopsora pachyrhizi]